jgi:alkyl hydroperoxide reductase subunit F
MADIEIYSKEWCPYCAKAKALLRSKELAYREIDITYDAEREQEMIERSHRRTVPQVVIDGQPIGGYDDLAQLNVTGELDRRLGIETGPQLHKLYDVAVIGAGPAGMSAAIYAARKNLSTIIVTEDVGGQLGTTYEVSNYPGYLQISGPDLVQRFAAQLDQYDVDNLIGEQVVDVRVKSECKILGMASGREVQARTLIVASGAHKRRLNVLGERELAGKGVVYCSTCDGPLFKGLSIAVVGGGNSALEAAIEMDGLAEQVHLVSRGEWTGDAILQDKVSVARRVEVLKHHEPVQIHGTEHVDGFTVRDLRSGEVRRLEVRGVFVEIGLFPNTEFILDLVHTNERGEIRVDSHGHTGVRGIFAAGDATDVHDKQIVIAAGGGANAALGAFEYLLKQM